MEANKKPSVVQQAPDAQTLPAHRLHLVLDIYVNSAEEARAPGMAVAELAMLIAATGAVVSFEHQFQTRDDSAAAPCAQKGADASKN